METIWNNTVEHDDWLKGLPPGLNELAISEMAFASDKDGKVSTSIGRAGNPNSKKIKEQPKNTGNENV